MVRRGLLKSSGAAAVLPPAVLRMPCSDRGEVCWLPRAAPKPEPVRSTDSCMPTTLQPPSNTSREMSRVGCSNHWACRLSVKLSTCHQNTEGKAVGGTQNTQQHGKTRRGWGGNRPGCGWPCA